LVNESMNDTAYFQIVYDGPALENNEMDVRELAPSLVAIADLLEEANAIVNGGGTKVNVNVHGSFKNGSFGIDFNLIQTTFQGFLSLFGSDNITATVNLLTLIGFIGAGTKGLIALLKKLKNRNIQKIEDIENNRVRIHITREEIVDFDSRVLDLYKSQRVRDALDKIIAQPLGRPGINEFRAFSPQDKEPVIIKKEEKEFFEMPLLGDELLGENVTEAYLQLVNVSFKEDNKWRFSRGELTFYASVLDERFLNAINRNDVHFSKDDILKVKLRAKDMLTDKGMHTEFAVLEVLEHRSAARQLLLPVVDKDEDDNKSPT